MQGCEPASWEAGFVTPEDPVAYKDNNSKIFFHILQCELGTTAIRDSGLSHHLLNLIVISFQPVIADPGHNETRPSWRIHCALRSGFTISVVQSHQGKTIETTVTTFANANDA